MHRRLIPLLALLVAAPLALGSTPAPPPAPSGDLAAARALFERNLDAIRKKDRDAYVACYVDAPTLARTGPDGSRLGYAELLHDAGSPWPDFFEARDLRLVPVSPGVVYGTYRYRVRYGADEQSGLSERVFLFTPQGWRITVSSAFPAPPGTPPPPLALVGATLIDGTGAAPVRDAVVVMRGGKIECAGPRAKCRPPEGVETLDLAGMWITPGLIDAHVHFSQTGWADGRPDSLDLRAAFPYEEVQAGLRRDPERFFRSYLCSGVTAVFDVGGYPWTLELPERAERSTLAPHVAASGPLLSTLDFWLNLPGDRQFIYVSKEDDARSGVNYLADLGAKAIKVWFIPSGSPDFDGMARTVAAAGDEARRRGKPLIVHATGLREAKAALAAGARLLVHSVGDKEVDDEFITLAKKQGTIYCPTLTVLEGYWRMFASVVTGKPPEVDDPDRCVDRETLDHIAATPKLAAGKMTQADLDKRAPRREALNRFGPLNLRKVRDAGIPIAMGTDAGNPLTLHGPSVHAEMEAMQAAGMTPMEVLVSATRTAALAMGWETTIGTVEAKKLADLLIVGGDPAADIANLRKVKFVVRGGVVRSIDELRRAEK